MVGGDGASRRRTRGRERARNVIRGEGRRGGFRGGFRDVPRVLRAGARGGGDGRGRIHARGSRRARTRCGRRVSPGRVGRRLAERARRVAAIDSKAKSTGDDDIEGARRPCDGRSGATTTCIGEGIAGADDVAGCVATGAAQAAAALKALRDDGAIPIRGPVASAHAWLPLGRGFETKSGTTAAPALGYSFAAGTTDGPGADGFVQGDTDDETFAAAEAGAGVEDEAEDEAEDEEAAASAPASRRSRARGAFASWVFSGFRRWGVPSSAAAARAQTRARALRRGRRRRFRRRRRAVGGDGRPRAGVSRRPSAHRLDPRGGVDARGSKTRARRAPRRRRSVDGPRRRFRVGGDRERSGERVRGVRHDEGGIRRADVRGREHALRTKHARRVRGRRRRARAPRRVGG